jgi:membrane-bound metal-dependent hydrolase YbcI (DUF457 family)
MDIISHLLIGNAISLPCSNKKCRFWVIFFSILPDISQIPFYIFLGYINKRLFFFPLNSDWVGAKIAHPVFSALWEIPHSIFFALLIILPVILIFKIPKLAFASYLVHIFLDFFTHTGEWTLKPFYPLNYTLQGFTDAWAWSLPILLFSWAVIIIITLIITPFFKTKKIH